MKQFNQKGEETPADHVQVNLRDFGVTDHKKQDIFPEDNPHALPRAFANTLIHSGRATLHVPVADASPEIENGDPTVQNADTPPKGKRKK